MDTTHLSSSRIALQLAMLIETAPKQGITNDTSAFARSLREAAVAAPRSRGSSGGPALFSKIAEGLGFVSDAGCHNLLKTLEPDSELLSTTENERIRAAAGAAIAKHLDLEVSSAAEFLESQRQYKATLLATLYWTLLFALPFLAFVGIRTIDKPEAPPPEQQPAIGQTTNVNSDQTKNAAQSTESGSVTNGSSPPPTVSEQTAADPAATPGTETTEEKSHAGTAQEPDSFHESSPAGSPNRADNDGNGYEENRWYLDSTSKPFKTFARIALLCLVSISGAWGAFLAYHLRVRTKAVPDNSTRIPIMCPMMGALFGFIVFLLLASQLVEGRIFPTSRESEWQAMLFVPGAMFCLALWCLIGGFAQARIINILRNLSKDLEKQASQKQSTE